MGKTRKKLLVWVMCFVMLFTQTGGVYAWAAGEDVEAYADASENSLVVADEEIVAEEKWDGASYNSDYKQWSQKESDYSGMRSSGCSVVALSKIVYETGINNTTSFNPDVLYNWGTGNGTFNSGGYVNDWSKVSNYASERGKQLSWVGDIQCSSEQDIINKLKENDNYYIVASVQGQYVNGSHFVCIDRQSTLNNSTVWIYDSASGFSTLHCKMTDHKYYPIKMYVYKANASSSGSSQEQFPSSFPLVDGKRYVIKSVLSNKAIEVSNGESTNRKQLNLWSYSYPGEKWWTWIAVKQSNGYVFKNAHTGMAMDIKYASQDEGKEVVQCTVDGAASQTFKLYSVGDGKYGLINANSNKAVDVYGSNTDDGATLNQYSWHGKSNQLWYFEPADRDFVLYMYPNGGVFPDGTTATKAPEIRLEWGSGKWWWDISRFNPTREGYTLDGWYTSPDGGAKIYGADGLRVNDGTYWKDNIYVYEGDCHVYAHWTKTDQNAPSVSATVKDLSPEGYTVVAVATDESGIQRVCFPTWTGKDGQDDIFENWGDTTTGTPVGENTCEYRVNVRDHKNESGTYYTHVYAWDNYGNYVCYEMTIDVPAYVGSIVLSETDKDVSMGDCFNISATIGPDNAANKNISWSSSDTAVATVDEYGNVTAVSKGSCMITATAQDGSGVSASCTVNVKNTVYQIKKGEIIGSSHPYDSDSSDVWVYSESGAESITISFSDSTRLDETTEGDYIEIRDVDNHLVSRYYGTALAGKSVTVQGDTVRIQLVSDSEGEDAYGFDISGIKTGNEITAPDDNTESDTLTGDNNSDDLNPVVEDESGSGTDSDAASDTTEGQTQEVSKKVVTVPSIIAGEGKDTLASTQKISIKESYSKAVKFVSKNKNVATVNKKGIVTVKGGNKVKSGDKSVIKAYDEYGELLGEYTVTVTKPEIIKKTIKLTSYGEIFEALSNIKGTDKVPTSFESSNTKVLSIDKETGTIITKDKGGTATITAYYGTGKNAAKYRFKVKVLVPKLNKDNLVIKAKNGGKIKSVTLKLKNMSGDEKVTWKTSDASVATVQNGKVTAKKEGVAVVSAVYKDREYKCNVSVNIK